MKAVLALAVVLFASASFATIQDEFDLMKDSGENFEIVGQVCELVAQHDYEAQYPAPKYEVVNGIAYGDNNRTIGELDVVVFDTASRNVVTIGEAKCWKDNHAALSKANDQKQRFMSNVSRGGGLHFTGTHDHRSYSQSQFKGVHEFRSIGPKGAKADGFNVELSYTLDELMGLRQKLMDCQNAGQCKHH